MKIDEVKEKGSKYLFQNYGRIDLCFDHGEGMYLYDLDGRKYLDLVAGIAVNSIGYSHPKWVNAIQKKASELVHVSNLYQVKEQADAAEAIASITPKGLDRTLFVNSGAEANEGSMKVAVRYTGKRKILSALNSFHGRTAGALGATGQTKYQDTFQTLISDCFDYFDYDSCESVKSMVDKDTAAVIVEPIQGEGGVRTASAEFFKTVRDVCTDRGALMIVDEVQTGMGRTGRWLGIDNFNVVPDIISLAKALGGGVPVGAVVTTDEISSVMTPGTHGTTFGGTPLVCTAVSATIDVMKEEDLVQNSHAVGKYLKDRVSKIDSDEIVDVRGYGLMIGIEMRSKASDFQKYCRDNGILINVCHGNTVRLIPPLIMKTSDADIFVESLDRFLN
ncbi:aspartate aminotransferase family protein [Candidatus Methanarcanum hacksteinii]|uniref:aspartate aminotransferase family protein n=1 Tax=Candidatus Methanarcanum hacksteinii TaxID=2911857 RepID=UPI0037DC9BFA